MRTTPHHCNPVVILSSCGVSEQCLASVNEVEEPPSPAETAALCCPLASATQTGRRGGSRCDECCWIQESLTAFAHSGSTLECTNCGRQAKIRLAVHETQTQGRFYCEELRESDQRRGGWLQDQPHCPLEAFAAVLKVDVRYFQVRKKLQMRSQLKTAMVR